MMNVLSHTIREVYLVKSDQRVFQVVRYNQDDIDRVKVYEITLEGMSEVHDQSAIEMLTYNLVGTRTTGEHMVGAVSTPVEIKPRRKPGPKPGFKRRILVPTPVA